VNDEIEGCESGRDVFKDDMLVLFLRDSGNHNKSG